MPAYIMKETHPIVLRHKLPEVMDFESSRSSFGTVLLGDVSTHGTESSGRSMLGDEVERGGGSAVTATDLDAADVCWESASSMPSWASRSQRATSAVGGDGSSVPPRNNRSRSFSMH